MSVEAIGKRLISDSDQVLFERYPNSEDVRYWPAGKPTPVIESFIMRSGKKFWQLQGEPEFYYLADSPALDVVAPDAADRSGWFETLTYPIASWFGNTERDITKNAGFVSDGFEKSVTGLKTDLINIGDYIKPIIWGLAAIIALLLLNKWT